jgi:hypothetical protein
MLRLLFCSYHCYLDPSSGAALATRDLFELMASRGSPCEVFCGAATGLRGTATATPIAHRTRSTLRGARLFRWQGALLALSVSTGRSTRHGLLPRIPKRRGASGAPTCPDPRAGLCLLGALRAGAGAVSARCDLDLWRPLAGPGDDGLRQATWRPRGLRHP